MNTPSQFVHLPIMANNMQPIFIPIMTQTTHCKNHIPINTLPISTI